MPTLIFTGVSSGLGLHVLRLVLDRLTSLPTPSSSASPSSFVWRLICGTRAPQPSPEQVKLSHAADAFPELVELLWLPLDLADGMMGSTREFVRLVREEYGVEEVQGVVLNAAVWGGAGGEGKRGRVGGEEYVEEAVVNHFAQHHLVQLLLPLLKTAASASPAPFIPPRIVYTSSNLHESVGSLDDLPSVLTASPPTSSKMRYAASKIAALIGAQSLLEDFSSSSVGVDVVAVSPGFVPTTGLSRHSGWVGQLLMRYVMSWAPFAVTEDEGAARILRALPLPSSSLSSASDLSSLLSSSRASQNPRLLYLSGPSTAPLDEVAKPVGGALGRVLREVERGEEGAREGWEGVKGRWAPFPCTVHQLQNRYDKHTFPGGMKVMELIQKFPHAFLKWTAILQSDQYFFPDAAFSDEWRSRWPVDAVMVRGGSGTAQNPYEIYCPAYAVVLNKLQVGHEIGWAMPNPSYHHVERKLEPGPNCYNVAISDSRRTAPGHQSRRIGLSGMGEVFRNGVRSASSNPNHPVLVTPFAMRSKDHRQTSIGKFLTGMFAKMHRSQEFLMIALVRGQSNGPETLTWDFTYFKKEDCPELCIRVCHSMTERRRLEAHLQRYASYPKDSLVIRQPEARELGKSRACVPEGRGDQRVVVRRSRSF
ncbi:hypothetical protein JCM6882_007399 [Rhodosporidiobolus microsporus]